MRKRLKILIIGAVYCCTTFMTILPSFIVNAEAKVSSVIYQNDINSSNEQVYNLRDENPSMHYEKLRITGIKSLNNIFDCVDYKITQSNFIKYSNRAYNEFNTIWGSEYDYLEKIAPDSKMNQYRPINGDEKEAWLLNNGYLSIPKSYNFMDSFSCTSNDVYTDKENPEFYLSDFLMSLYKSVYGVIESKPVMHKSCSHRDGFLVGEGNRMCCGKSDSSVKDYWLYDLGIKVDNARFEDIDRTLYVSPDVYELYLYQLYNLGVIGNVEMGKKCIGSVDLIKEFLNIQSKSNLPDWYTDGSKVPYMVSGGGKIEKNVLGSTVNIHAEDSYEERQFKIEGTRDEPVKYISNNLNLTRSKPKFMMDEENFTKMDCLKFIESILKTKEKNLSKEEADIIAYKFGSGFLINLENSDKDTVTYLTAKGIIKPDSIDYVADLYSPAKKSDCIDYLYRVANKDFRLDFSKIQMTDSDRYWQDKGFVEQDLNVITIPEDKELPYLRTIKIVTPSGSVVENPVLDIDLPDLSKNEQIISLLGAPGKAGSKSPNSGQRAPEVSKSGFYEIVRLFSKTGDYSYGGKKIKDLKVENGVIKEIKTVKFNSVDFYMITFLVSDKLVNNSQSALAYVNSRTKLVGDWDNSKTYTGISRITKDGTLLEAVPKSCFDGSDSEIQCIGDKYLVNVKTGAEAVIIPEDNIALVGNSIIKSDSIMLFSANKEVFYDFSVINALMTNNFKSEIDPWTTFKYNTSTTQSITEQGSLKSINYNKKLSPVIGSTGQEVQKTETISLTDFPSESNTVSSVNMYNKTLTSKGLNSLTRTFSYDKKTYTLVIDWMYAPPDDTMFKQFDLGKVSVGKMSEYMRTRPDDEVGQRWWDLNLKVSNMLCNMLYETKSIDYIKSGFLVPKVRLLGTNKLSSTVKDIDITNICSELGLSKDKFYKENPIHTVVTTLMNDKFCDEIEFIKRSGKVPNFSSLDYMGYKYSEMSVYLTGCASPLGYFVDGNIVYEDISKDSRITQRNKSLYLQTRYTNPSGNSNLTIGSRVRIGEKVYVYYGTENGYHKLLSLDTFSGTASKVNGDFVVRSGNKKVTDIVQQIVKGLPGGYKVESETKSSSAGIGTHLSVHTGIFLEEGKAYNRVAEIPGQGTNRIDTVNIKEGSTVNTLPTIFLDINKWVYNKGFMEYGGSSPYSQISSLYYSGINNSVIDSILFKCYNSIRLKDLPNGARVTIGDICMVKQGDKYISTPIDINLIKSGLLKNPQSFKSYLTNVFSGISISYSQKPVNFIRYISDIDFGMLPEGVGSSNTLIRDKGYLKIDNNGKEDAPLPGFSNAKTFCLEMSLEDDDLYCRKLNKGNSVYQLLYSTDRYGEGYLEDVPFNIDNINLEKAEDYLFFSGKSKFKPIEKFNSIINFLQSEYRNALAGDVKSFIRLVLVAIVSYLIVMSWVCFCFLKGQLGMTFLNALKNPGSGNKGFDLLKILSLGMYNIDTEVKYHVLFISNIIMFAILHVLLKI